MQTIQNIDDKTFNQVAQLGHFAGGLAIVFGSVVLFGGRHAIIPALLIMAAVVGVKEFWWDYKYESAQVRGSSLLDFSMYLAGGLLAAAATYIRNF